MDSAQLPNLFLDEESSDIQLHIHTSAEDKEIVVPAHSLVLRTAGERFRTILGIGSLEVQDRNSNVKLVVKGDAHDAIRFLRYLYTRELEDVELMVYISILQTAHLYELYDLARLCNERIAGQLTPLTVCRTYRSIKNLASESLLAHCKDLMLDCAFLIFWKNLHLTLDEKTMLYLFASERLNFLDQEQALGALRRWGCAHRAFASQTDKDKEGHVANLLTQMETSLEDNASFWSFGMWKKFALPSGTSDLLKKYTWKYWATGKDEGAAKPPSGKYVIQTEPRLVNKITTFSTVCNLIESKSSPGEISVSGKSTRMMNISVNRNILLAGFAIQLKWSTKALTGEKEVRENLSFRLNDKKLPVDNYTIKKVSKLYYIGPEKRSEDFNVSDLKIRLRTPVFLQKAKMNILTIEFEPRPLFSISLTAYRFPEGSMSRSDNTGLFSKDDEKVALSKLYYFV